MSMSRILCSLIVAGALVAFVPTTGSAQDVQAGIDLLETNPAATQFDFLLTPIPADFFDPGSDPFNGALNLDGVPLGSSPLCPNDDLSQADTAVKRLANAVLPGFPTNDVIPIEIVELSLVSIAPVVVTFNGGQNPELWDVDVDLSTFPQPQGQMAIVRQNAGGGTFDTTLPVLPRFTFTRQSDLQVRVLDFGAEAIPPVNFNAANTPWINWTPPPTSCTSNWCPGGPFVLVAPNATHGVVPICPTPIKVPTLSTWMTILLAMLLVVAGMFLVRRRVVC